MQQQQQAMKRCRELFVRDTPRKRRRLDLDSGAATTTTTATRGNDKKQNHELDDANDSDCIVVSLSAPESPDWRVLDIPLANSAPSDAATSPHTPRAAFEWQDTRDVSLVSPLDSLFSPATEYSEWLPLSPAPGSETIATARTTTRRKLVQHFSDVVAPLLLFGRSAERFRELLLPLAGDVDNGDDGDDESALTSAMCAVAGAHLKRAATAADDNDAAELKTMATDFHSRALAGLAELIERGGEPQVALATIMLLVAYEIVGGGTSADMIEHHLRGAYSILSSLQSERNELTTLLENQICFYSLSVGLSLGTPPIGFVPELGGGTASAVTFRGRKHLDRPPTVAEDLWPVLWRLAALPSIKEELAEAVDGRQASRAAVLRGEVGAACLAAETLFTAWIGDVPEGVDLDSDLESRMVLACSHGGLVYLYRRILGYPQRHHLVQANAHSALEHCGAILEAGGGLGLSWPLFTAACEVAGPGRELATRLLEVSRSDGSGRSSSINREAMGSMEDVWAVVQGVWREVDGNAAKGLRADDTATTWRRVERDKGVRLILA